MKAIVYEAFKGPLHLREVPSPDPLPHGVVVKTRATGLCLSDWHGWQGHDTDIVLPHVPGHELAGEIVAVGKEVRNFHIGDRVTVPFVGGCGHCPQCHSGNQQVCDHQSQPGFTHWGSFAEYTRLDYADENLVVLPEEISDETASLLGCRFVTAFRAVVDQGQVQGGQWVAIHGCGGVGLSALLIARALGARVIAVDINFNTLQRAKTLGADAVVNPQLSLDVAAEIRERTGGGAHVSLDALGHPQTCFNSIANLRKRGKHVQVGLMTGADQHPKVPMDQVIARELEILGSHGMQAHKYPQMLEMIRSGILHPELLLEQTVSLSEAIELLPNMHRFERSGVTVINTFK